METAAPAFTEPSRAPEGRRPSLRSTLWRISGIVLLAAAYVVTAHAGLAFEPAGGFATLVWVPTGLSLAALLWRGGWLWPGVTIGAVVANLMQGAPLLVALGIAAGNTGEALLGFALLSRVVHLRLDFSRVKDALGLLVFGATLSTLLSATVGVATLLLAGLISGDAVAEVAYVWWIGDAMGALIITPLLLTWIADPRPPSLEDIAMWCVVLLAGLLDFAQILPPEFARAFPYSYLVFPPLIWGAVRRGPRSTATAVALLSAVAVTTAALSYGRFQGVTLEDRLLGSQTFMGIVAVTVSLLSAAIKERQDRDRLISVASHELRSPLTALALQNELLADAVRAGASHEKLGGIVARARRPLVRLAELIGELLDVSRAARGAIVLNRQDLDLRELVEEVASRLEVEYSQAGSRLDLQLEPARGYWDRSRLDQVVSNLLSNAAKFGAGAPVTLTLSGRNGKARLVVEDRGSGIDAGDARRVFEPFVQVGHGAAARGMGLGLAISRQIVLAHGGRIWVESRPGAGSRFIVELPGIQERT